MLGKMTGAALALLCTATAEARVVRLEISQREVFAGGQEFGAVGAYEKIAGRYFGELDPADPLNAVIVDLDKAPRNASGKVEYSSAFVMLKPVDMARGNRALLYDVNNRGNMRALVQFNSAPAANDPSTPAHAGNGFLMRQGFTMLWSGWLPQQPKEVRLQLDAPIAQGVEAEIWDEFLFNNREGGRAALSYPAVSRDTTQAKLYVRARNADEPQLIAPDKWEFTGDRLIRLLPEGERFQMGAIYQLVYKAKNSPVSGIGFAATRDLVAFLRREAADDAGAANPLARDGKPVVTRALAHGTSQSGRYLRDFLYRGFNEDEKNRIVFDGMNPHVATGRLFLNFRFAQPNRMLHIAHGFQYFPDVSFPFGYGDTADPHTGRTDGILKRCTERKNCPKIVHSVTGTEYWQSGQSLITTDPKGEKDAEIPAGVRVYHLASTQHLSNQATMPKGVCAMSHNTLDYSPLMRNLLLALDRWTSGAAEPPASRYPRIADGTLVASTAPAGAIPGFTMAKGPAARPRIDYGPEYEKGIIAKALPALLPQSYPVLVPKMDADGNDIAGIRLPEVAVPAGTATGWSVRGKDAGGAGELCYLDGSFTPFARAKAEREASGDSRPSLEERYADAPGYAAKVTAAAAQLVREGYMLAEDAPRIAARAAEMRW